jgi:crotonobetainyl-CoA:carnitine CoA-transferase CaiB-like acyl-CoA transferase
MDQDQVFKGLKVVELASVLAGPAVGMFFAELGAEVVKIENPLTGGDITRTWRLAGEDPKSVTSAYYLSTNWGKKSLMWDISTESGRDKLSGELAKADLFITNLKPADIVKFGLGYDELTAKFPRLIYASLTGYGESDNRPAFDLVLQAETGFMSMNGTKESGPLKMPVALIDVLAAHQLKEGILTALYLREKSGKGSFVHVSLFDSAMASLANQASNFLVTGKTAELSGSLHPNIAPYGETFQTQDGKSIVLAVGTDAQFARLCEAMEAPHLVSDPRFHTNQSRVKYRGELAACLSGQFANVSSRKMHDKLLGADVPCAIIRDVGEAVKAPAAERLIQDNGAGSCMRTAVFIIR